jgi:hypothetical protein
VVYKQQDLQLVVNNNRCTAATEEYDGSAWTGGGNLGTARSRLAGVEFKLQDLVLVVIQQQSVNNTEEYDGSAWTAGGI